MSLVKSVEPWVKDIRQGKHPQAEMPECGTSCPDFSRWTVRLGPIVDSVGVAPGEPGQYLSRSVCAVDEFPSLEYCVMADLGHPAEDVVYYSFG
eukprot:g59625.t1